MRHYQQELRNGPNPDLSAKLSACYQFAGLIEYKNEWFSCPGRLPPSAFVSDESTTVSELAESGQVFYFPEQDIDLMDPNDPRKKGEKGVARTEEDITRQSLVPFRNAQSKRLFLLQARAHNPDLTGLEIPLIDDLIERDENLDRILRKELSIEVRKLHREAEVD